MIKTTIKELFGLKGLNNRVYVIYDDREPVYVGMANNQCVATRLAMHIKDVFDANKKNSSQLSKLLFGNHPRYFDWRVEVYTPCEILCSGCASCAEKAKYLQLSKVGYTLKGNARTPSSRCYCGT